MIIALYSAKGAPLHRKAGIVFVYTMLAMCAAGFTMAIGRGVAPAVNIPAALLTASLVVTALTTVRVSFRSLRDRGISRRHSCLCDRWHRWRAPRRRHVDGHFGRP